MWSRGILGRGRWLGKCWGNGTHFVWGGSKKQQIYGKFEGNFPETSALFGVVSYNDPLFFFWDIGVSHLSGQILATKNYGQNGRQAFFGIHWIDWDLCITVQESRRFLVVMFWNGFSFPSKTATWNNVPRKVAILGLSKTSSATVRAQTKIVAYTVEVAKTPGFPMKNRLLNSSLYRFCCFFPWIHGDICRNLLLHPRKLTWNPKIGDL